jgi:hypothetical protein
MPAGGLARLQVAILPRSLSHRASQPLYPFFMLQPASQIAEEQPEILVQLWSIYLSRAFLVAAW